MISTCIERGYVGLPPLATVRFAGSTPSPICKDWLDSPTSLRRCPIDAMPPSSENIQRISTGVPIPVSLKEEGAATDALSLDWFILRLPKSCNRNL